VPYIVWLDDPAATSAELVGPKAARLARLTQAGLPVPRAFCLTTQASHDQLRSAGLEAATHEVVEAVHRGRELKRAASLVRAALGGTPLKPEIQTALRKAFTQLRSGGSGLVAVRSSTLVEGCTGPSFVGQFSTFLGVRGFEELLAAVRACWASRWSDRAITYAQSLGSGLGQPRMGVLVQSLVPAESAGIALSAVPGAGGTDEIVVNGAWGLGRGVAEGEIVPDLWRLERTDLAIGERQIGYKPIAARVASETGEVWQRQSPRRARAASLGDGTLAQLGRLVLRVEGLLGAPQEIEWALAANKKTVRTSSGRPLARRDAKQGDSRLWLLQTRPLQVTSATPRLPPELVSRSANNDLVVRGQPTSGGQVMGRARVVRRPDDVALVQPGEILVVTFMRPSMTAVLARIAGLVVEAGGSTSHTASLARERRIPAIMGALGATRIIPDGALVVVDGDAGLAYPTEPRP
jgi:pyruvate,water dikinase